MKCEFKTDFRLRFRSILDLRCSMKNILFLLLFQINDADWELLGQTNYLLESGDNVTFISTLHGG